MIRQGGNPLCKVFGSLFPRYSFQVGSLRKAGGSKDLAIGAARAMRENVPFYSENLLIEPDCISPKIFLRAVDELGIIDGARQLTQAYMLDCGNARNIRLGLCIDFPSVRYESSLPGGYGYKVAGADVKDRAALEIFTAQQASLGVLNPSKSWNGIYTYGINPVFDTLSSVGNHFDAVRFPKQTRPSVGRRRRDSRGFVQRNRGKIIAAGLIGLVGVGSALAIDRETGVLGGLWLHAAKGFSGDYGFACRLGKMIWHYPLGWDGAVLMYDFYRKDAGVGVLSDPGLVLVGKIGNFDGFYFSSPDVVSLTNALGSMHLAGGATADAGANILRLQKEYPNFHSLRGDELQVVASVAGQTGIGDLSVLPNFLVADGMRYGWLTKDGLDSEESQWVKFWYDTCLQRYRDGKYVADVKSMPPWQAQYLMGFIPEKKLTKDHIQNFNPWEWKAEAEHNNSLALEIINTPGQFERGKNFFVNWTFKPYPKDSGARIWDQLTRREQILYSLYDWESQRPRPNSKAPNHILVSWLISSGANTTGYGGACEVVSDVVAGLLNSIGIPSPIVNFGASAGDSFQGYHSNPTIIREDTKLQIVDNWKSVAKEFYILPIFPLESHVYKSPGHPIWTQDSETGEGVWKMDEYPYPIGISDEAKFIGSYFRDYLEKG